MKVVFGECLNVVCSVFFELERWVDCSMLFFDWIDIGWSVFVGYDFGV